MVGRYGSSPLGLWLSLLRHAPLIDVPDQTPYTILQVLKERDTDSNDC